MCYRQLSAFLQVQQHSVHLNMHYEKKKDQEHDKTASSNANIELIEKKSGGTTPLPAKMQPMPGNLPSFTSLMDKFDARKLRE